MQKSKHLWGQRSVDRIKLTYFFNNIDLHAKRHGFRPKKPFPRSEFTLALNLYIMTGCWSIAKCSQSSRRNYEGGSRSWQPATCRFSTRRSFDHHGKGNSKKSNEGTETAFRNDHCKHFQKSKRLLRSEVSWCHQTRVHFQLHRCTCSASPISTQKVRVHAGAKFGHNYWMLVDRQMQSVFTPEPHRWISKLTARHLQILHQEIFWLPWDQGRKQQKRISKKWK